MMTAIAHSSASMLLEITPVLLRQLESVTGHDLMNSDIRNALLRNAAIVVVLMLVFSVSSIASAFYPG